MKEKQTEKNGRREKKKKERRGRKEENRRKKELRKQKQCEKDYSGKKQKKSGKAKSFLIFSLIFSLFLPLSPSFSLTSANHLLCRPHKDCCKNQKTSEKSPKNPPIPTPQTRKPTLHARHKSGCHKASAIHILPGSSSAAGSAHGSAQPHRARICTQIAYSGPSINTSKDMAPTTEQVSYSKKRAESASQRLSSCRPCSTFRPAVRIRRPFMCVI